jgi:hypothetical protein
MVPNDTAGLAIDKSFNSLVDSKLKKIAYGFEQTNGRKRKQN